MAPCWTYSSATRPNEMNAMKLLIGYGNTMRQDDGIGWLIADHLAPQYDDTDVTVIQAHQLMPEIASSMADADRVIFVDASIEGVAGEIQVQQLQPAVELGDAHALTPSQILRLTEYLYGQCPTTYLVTITGAWFDLGDTLSEAVEAAVPQAVSAIQSLLAD